MFGGSAGNWIVKGFNILFAVFGAALFFASTSLAATVLSCRRWLVRILVTVIGSINGVGNCR